MESLCLSWLVTHHHHSLLNIIRHNPLLLLLHLLLLVLPLLLLQWGRWGQRRWSVTSAMRHWVWCTTQPRQIMGCCAHFDDDQHHHDLDDNPPPCRQIMGWLCTSSPDLAVPAPCWPWPATKSTSINHEYHRANIYQQSTFHSLPTFFWLQS